MPDFWTGHIMKPEAVLELTGQEVHPDIFQIHPTGNLIHVLIEEPLKEIGNIILPDTVVGNERMGIGYIIAAGPRAGHSDYAAPGPSPVGVIGSVPLDSETLTPIHSAAESLLGLHVIFSQHIGMPIHVTVADRRYTSLVIVLSAKDIRGVDTNPKPLTRRAEAYSKRPTDEKGGDSS